MDVIASVMRNGGKIQELLDSELCYAPPYSSAKDPVNILGMAAENLLSGLFKPAYYEDIEGSFVIDVRTPDVFKINGIKGAINIPLAELRKDITKFQKTKKLF